MRKVALVFVVAVIVPSLVLAWLAVRSLQDQQFLIERQQSLLYQGGADGLSKNVQDELAEDQRVFATKLSALLEQHSPQELSRTFDDGLLRELPLAQVGFVVALPGNLSCPTPNGRQEARAFCTDNGRFLACGELAEVYWNAKSIGNNGSVMNSSVPDAQQWSFADKVNSSAGTKLRAQESGINQTAPN